MPPYHQESLAICQVLDFWSLAEKPQELRINAFTSKAYDELKARDRRRVQKKRKKANRTARELLDNQLPAGSVLEDACINLQDHNDDSRLPTCTSTVFDRVATQTIDRANVRDACDDMNMETPIPFAERAGTAQAVLGLLVDRNDQSPSCSSSIPQTYSYSMQNVAEPSTPLEVGTSYSPILFPTAIDVEDSIPVANATPRLS